MIKSDLRKQGYSVVEKFPRQSVINTMWVVLTLLISIVTYTAVFFIIGPAIIGGDGLQRDPNAILQIIDSFGLLGYFMLLILSVFLYLFLKLLMTIFFSSKIESIRMKILENKGMPICLCREALKVWQTVLIYLMPVILTYSAMFYLTVSSGFIAEMIIILFFMLIFMAFDLMLVIYVLAVKIKDKPDYISIDHHIYGYTVFNQTYVKFKRKNRKMRSRFLVTGAGKYLENGKFNWKNKN